MGMAAKQWKIQKDIERELSTTARKFVQKLIDELHNYQRQNAELVQRVETLEARLGHARRTRPLLHIQRIYMHESLCVL